MKTTSFSLTCNSTVFDETNQLKTWLSRLSHTPLVLANMELQAHRVILFARGVVQMSWIVDEGSTFMDACFNMLWVGFSNVRGHQRDWEKKCVLYQYQRCNLVKLRAVNVGQSSYFWPVKQTSFVKWQMIKRPRMLNNDTFWLVLLHLWFSRMGSLRRQWDDSIRSFFSWCVSRTWPLRSYVQWGSLALKSAVKRREISDGCMWWTELVDTGSFGTKRTELVVPTLRQEAAWKKYAAIQKGVLMLDGCFACAEVGCKCQLVTFS